MQKCFNIYGLGGAGITNLNHFLKNTNQGKFVENVLGVDFSDANPGTDGAYHIERMEGVEGSGSNKASNAPLAPDLVKRALAKLPPNKLNILIYSASGGSGSILGPYMVKAMLEKGIPVLSIVIGDSTSIKEMDNTVGTLRSLLAQAQLHEAPVLFCYRENSTKNTQGAINTEVTRTIDNALLMLNLNNERIDYADIKNLFFFTNVVKADPILSQVSFCNEEKVTEYKRVPVAALSIYNDIEQIRSPFSNLLYRKAGLFTDITKGYVDTAHVVLDHGSTLIELEEMIKEQQAKQAELAGRHKVKPVDLSDASPDGMYL
ncbi:putative tubulin-like protein [Aeromonas phage ZPAH34]|uniref:tubulin PhuZ n=1 Tax=Aeromonas phage ZPAH34 TaxID=2924888 RepID=UPI00232942E1|nr:tubulin PhuZ [Aeromonas phage ZPAH34]UOX39661.1 putative tubulin-like protein [Aeromonas phage ZPAH34]